MQSYHDFAKMNAVVAACHSVMGGLAGLGIGTTPVAPLLSVAEPVVKKVDQFLVVPKYWLGKCPSCTLALTIIDTREGLIRYIWTF